MKTFNINSLRNFQLSNVVLTIIPLRYITSPSLFDNSKSVYFTPFIPFPAPPPLATTRLFSVCFSLGVLFESTNTWHYSVFVCLCLTYPHLARCPQRCIYVYTHTKIQRKCEIYLYLFVQWWKFRLFLYHGYYIECCGEHGGAYSFSIVMGCVCVYHPLTLYWPIPIYQAYNCKTLILLTKALGHVNHRMGWAVFCSCQAEEPRGTGGKPGNA